jgi:NADH-quinone oxidoreductase subunit J
MVLFIFVVMMLHLGERSIKQEMEWFSPSMCVGPGVLTLILLAEMLYLIFPYHSGSNAIAVVDAKEVGLALYGPYLICVELSAILLMAGIVGAYHLGKEKKTVLHRFLQNEEKNG